MKLNPWPYFVVSILFGTLVLNVIVFRAASSSRVLTVTDNAYEESLALNGAIEAKRRFFSVADLLELEIDARSGEVKLSGLRVEHPKLSLVRPDSSASDITLQLNASGFGSAGALTPGLYLLELEFERDGERYLYKGQVMLSREPMKVRW